MGGYGAVEVHGYLTAKIQRRQYRGTAGLCGLEGIGSKPQLSPDRVASVTGLSSQGPPLAPL